MLVRLTQHWNGNPPGREIEPGDGVANMLIRRGIAKPVRKTRSIKPPEGGSGPAKKEN